MHHDTHTSGARAVVLVHAPSAVSKLLSLIPYHTLVLRCIVPSPVMIRVNLATLGGYAHFRLAPSLARRSILLVRSCVCHRQEIFSLTPQWHIHLSPELLAIIEGHAEVAASGIL